MYIVLKKKSFVVRINGYYFVIETNYYFVSKI